MLCTNPIRSSFTVHIQIKYQNNYISVVKNVLDKDLARSVPVSQGSNGVMRNGSQGQVQVRSNGLSRMFGQVGQSGVTVFILTLDYLSEIRPTRFIW